MIVYLLKRVLFVAVVCAVFLALLGKEDSNCVEIVGSRMPTVVECD